MLPPCPLANFFHPVKWLPPILQPLPTIVGGLLIELTLGTLYSVGNMIPYLVSYVRIVHGSDVTSHDAGWITSMAIIGLGCTLPFGGILERYTGPRIAAFVGCFFASFGTLISFVTVKSSFWACAVTYGLVVGFGAGIGYGAPMVCATRWLPNYKGLVIGIIVGGFGCGSLIFNQVETAYINPHNIKVSSDGYFHDKDLLDRVPYCFLVLGGCYAAVQLVGLCLLFDAPEVKSQPDVSTHESRRKASEFFSLRPLKLLSSPTFYCLWLSMLFLGQVNTLITPYYKIFGQTFINDDVFLATTGSLASIMNALGRIFWGHVADKSSFQISMACLTSYLTFLLLTLQISPLAGKAFYTIWILLLNFGFSGTYSLFPFATVKCFGQPYFGINYGLVFSSQIVTSVISALLAEQLIAVINFNGLFFLVAGFSFISFILTTFVGITRHGHPPVPSNESQQDLVDFIVEDVGINESGNNSNHSVTDEKNIVEEDISPRSSPDFF